MALPPVITHEAVPGRFGPLTVQDIAGARRLSCGSSCHGSSWLEPAAVVDGQVLVPGPIPESLYLLGWLVAVQACPAGHVLMAGLGSGAGPIALCWAYPRLRVTVVEIDPAVVDLARRHFPLLGHFEAQGRLRIVVEDILAHVWLGEDADWSVACLDAFGAQEDLVCPSALLQALHGRAEALWLNVLEQDGEDAVAALGDRLIDAGWTPRTALPILDPEDQAWTGNVLLGTQGIDREAIAALRPFAELDHPRVERIADQCRTLAGLARPWEGAWDAAQRPWRNRSAR